MFGTQLKTFLFWVLRGVSPSCLSKFYPVIWAFDRLIFRFLPLGISHRVTISSIYYNCGFYRLAVLQYQSILKEEKNDSLLESVLLTDQMIQVFEKGGARGVFLNHLMATSIKDRKLSIHICRVLFRMGELGLCNEVLTDYYSHGSCQSPKDFLRFVKIRPYTDKFPEAGQRHNFMPAAQMSFQGPVVFGQSPGTRSYELTIPPLDVLTFYDVDVIGANQIIQDDNLIVVDPAANPASGFVAGSWPFVGGTSSDPDQAMVWFPFERKQILERAILLNGRCSSNYFHFLIEYLPRSIAFLKSPSAFDKMPLIVESSLPSQFFEAIQIIFGKDKSLFYRDDFVTLRVKELFTPSYQTYLPDSLDIPFWQGGGFSKTCLEFIRAQVGTALGISFHTPHTGPENKIFLSRAKVKNRTIINQKEIETAFEQKGYKIIFVEELSFREQVYLFSNATHIAGQAGAALANLIFCRPGTKVIALIAQQNSDYVLPANLAREFGSDLIYVTGEHLRPRYSYPSDSLYIHSGFKVSLSKIRDLLKSLDY